ncbi:MAG: hypothetical protein ACI85Z_001139, partial [Rheinheimera aquimaris]
MTLKKLLLVGLVTTLTATLVACSGEDQSVPVPSVAVVDSTPGLADGAYALISVDVTEDG